MPRNRFRRTDCNKNCAIESADSIWESIHKLGSGVDSGKDSRIESDESIQEAAPRNRFHQRLRQYFIELLLESIRQKTPESIPRNRLHPRLRNRICRIGSENKSINDSGIDSAESIPEAIPSQSPGLIQQNRFRKRVRKINSRIDSVRDFGGDSMESSPRN
jgi:hypothetical protein